MNLLMSILAQEPRPPGGISFLLPAMLLAMVTFMLLSARSQKKREKREREEMHARIAKNDRVLTIGGVVGTVFQVKENEVVLKVDESTNTKMTFTKAAIQRLITDDQQLGGDRKR